MKLFKTLSFLYIIIFFLSCTKEKDIQPSIIGRWQSVYQRGYSINANKYIMDKVWNSAIFEFKPDKSFNEYVFFMRNGKDTTIKLNSYPYKIAKDSIVFTKHPYYQAPASFNFFYNYRIEKDTLVLIENLETRYRNNINELVAVKYPYKTSEEEKNGFPKLEKDYFLEIKFKKIQ